MDSLESPITSGFGVLPLPRLEAARLELDPYQLLVVGELEQVAPALVLPDHDGPAVLATLELSTNEGDAEVPPVVHQLHGDRERGLRLNRHDLATVGLGARDELLDRRDRVVPVADVVGDDFDVVAVDGLQEGLAVGVHRMAGDADYDILGHSVLLFLRPRPRLWFSKELSLDIEGTVKMIFPLHCSINEKSDWDISP